MKMLRFDLTVQQWQIKMGSNPRKALNTTSVKHSNDEQDAWHCHKQRPLLCFILHRPDLSPAQHNLPRHRKWRTHQASEVPEGEWLLYTFPQLIQKILPVHFALLTRGWQTRLTRAWAIIDASARSRTFIFHPNAEARFKHKHSEGPVGSCYPHRGDPGRCSATHTGVTCSPQVEPRPPAAKAPGEKCFQQCSGAHILGFLGCTPDWHWVPCGPVPSLSTHTLHKCRYLGNGCTEIPPGSSWGTC